MFFALTFLRFSNKKEPFFWWFSFPIIVGFV